MRSSMMLKVPAGLIAAVLAVASSAPAAQAQDVGFAAKMNVPFAFQTASGQHFAPGVYTIPGCKVLAGQTASACQIHNDEPGSVIGTETLAQATADKGVKPLA